jgi:hypothetical protein
MADMGIYSLWPVFTALSLPSPRSAEALATHTCMIMDHVSRVTQNDFSYPTACTLRFEFAERQDFPSVDLFWYDGGMRPRLPRELEKQGIQLDREGILFQGDDGLILAGFNGQNPSLFVQGRKQPFPEQGSSAADRGATRRYAPWIEACRGGAASPGNFLNAAAITDAVNLGTVALRAGTKVIFDSEAMRITNSDGANRYLTREYRSGWEL